MDDDLYLSRRQGNTFGYEIAVANGSYVVDLSFSEFYWTTTGKRYFDIKIEGQTVLDNFDVRAAAGAVDTAYTTSSILVDVTDGVLDIDFDAELRTPFVNAISIRSSTDAGPNTAPVALDDAASSTGSPVTIAVLSNDSDADSDPVSLASFGQGSDGTVSRDDNGTPGDTTDDMLVYTPGAGFSGTDSFTYTVEDGQGGSDTATVTVSEISASAFELNINAGGGAYTASDGRQYVADTYFVGGSLGTDSGAIAGTVDDDLYLSRRQGNTFGYEIAVANGSYVVDLSFSEFYWTTTGKRYFDIKIEGQTVLDNFDVRAAAGAVDTAYTTSSILVDVTDGVLDIDFDAELRTPFVNAISIRSSTDAGPNTAPVALDDAASSTGSPVTIAVLSNDSDADSDPVSLASFGQGSDGTVSRDDNGTPGDTTDDMLVYTPGAGFSGTDSFTYTVEDGQGGSDTATVTVSEISASAFELNINAGGGAYTASDGRQYVADTYFVGGSLGTDSGAIAGTVDDDLYLSRRQGNTFGYEIAVANGSYVVDLSFSEFYWTTTGKRYFDIKIEGQTVLDNFDVRAAAGAVDTAYTTSSILVDVTDGVLDIDFDAELRTPFVNAISIRSSTDGMPPVPENDAYSIGEDGTLTVPAATGVLANDVEPDDEEMTAVLKTGPTNGSVDARRGRQLLVHAGAQLLGYRQLHLYRDRRVRPERDRHRHNHRRCRERRAGGHRGRVHHVSRRTAQHQGREWAARQRCRRRGGHSQYCRG